MKDWTWKNWIGVAAVFGGFWLLCYGLYWRSRTHPAISVGDALINWWGDVVLLQWVDTTLASGVLAVIAASTVLIAAAIDRRHRRREAQFERIDGALTIIDRAQLSLRRLGHEITTKRRYARTEQIISEIEAQCALLISEARVITLLIMFCVARVRELSLAVDGDTIAQDQSHALAIVWGGILSLETPERHFPPGRRATIVRRKIKLQDEVGFEFNRLTEEERTRFAVFLDWSE